MKDSILIPTDFTVTSLNLLNQALKDAGDKKQSFVLLFDCNSNDSITDLLFSTKSQIISSKANTSFLEGLEILKSKYENVINSIRVEPFYGYTKAAFRNFISANHISSAYLPSESDLKSHIDLVSICRYAQKVNLNSVVINQNKDENTYSNNSILQLLSV